MVRAEGLAELVGDLVMICTGGTPTPVGSPVPQVNVTVALNTNITSRILAGSLTEALAMIDEPGTPGSSPQLLCGTPGTIESPTGTCNGITGTGTGRGVYSGTGVRANVFQGQLSASTQVVWTGIPLDPPGSASRIIRFTNIRANASIIGSGSAAPGIIAAAISISGITSVSLSNSVNNVAFVQTGIAFAVRTAANTSNLSTAVSVPMCTQRLTRISTLRFQEGFASSFRPRTAAPFADSSTSPAPVDQNVPGQLYQTESGFRNGSFLNDTTHGNVSTAGLADFGTRLVAQFTNLPPGATIAVDSINMNASTGSTARLVSSEAGGFLPSLPASQSNPLVTLPVVSGTATVIWEVLAANPNATESFDFGVYVFYSGSATSGNAQVRGGLTPIGTVGTASATASVPRFSGPVASTNIFSIGPSSSCSALSIGPSPVTFTLPAGGGPSNVVVTIQATPNPGLIATIFPYTFSAGNWLTVGANSSDLPGSVVVTASAAGLTAGTYRGALLIGAIGANNSAVVPVDLAVGTSSPPSTDRLYVGAMTLASFATLSSVPLPNSVNQKFCDPVRLAPDMLAWAYVPTPAERAGDFSSTAASAQMLDPLTNAPFPGNRIPANRFADPYAWRIAATGPAAGENCMPVPATLPQFSRSYQVTGRNTDLDKLILDRNPISINYQPGSAPPSDQFANVLSQASGVDLIVGRPTSSSIDPSRWLRVTSTVPCCTTPTAFRFHFEPEGLRPGVYTASLPVTPLGAIGLPLSASVTITIAAPSNWIVVDPPTLSFSQQPGGSPPQDKIFNVTIAANRQYSVRTRIISPGGVDWVGVRSNSGVGPGPVAVFIQESAKTLPPGSYMAIVEIVAESALPLPAFSVSPGQGLAPAAFALGGVAAGTSVVCGGGLSSEQLAIFLDVGTAPITIAPAMPRDADTGYPVLGLSYIAGGPIQQPAAITFQPVGNGISGNAYDVKTIVRNPDPANLPPSTWLDASPRSASLPAIVTPMLLPSALGTLAPCDYEGYIAISNRDAGSILKLKLKVDPTSGSPDEPPNVTKVMSQIADGGPAAGGWKTTIILMNTDSTRAANYRLLFYPGKDGDQPISPDAPFNVSGPGSGGPAGNRVYQGTIMPGGAVTLTTKGPGGPFWQGWAELSAPDTVGGTAIFAQTLDAVSDAEGSVLVKPAAGNSFLLPFDNDSARGLLTTMSLVNTSGTAGANITVKFRDPAGDVFGQSTVVLGPRGHEAFALVSRFPALADRKGVAEFITDGPAIAGLGLRFSQKQHTFTSFEIITPLSGGTRQALAHVPDGDQGNGVWKTAITLVNLDPSQSNTVTLRFHNGQSTPAGQALALENGSTGTYTTTLQANGSATISTSGGSQLWRGWAEVVSSTAMGGFAVFQEVQTGGQLEGTVSFTPIGSARFVLPFDNARATGLAIANTSDQQITLTAGFRDGAGQAMSGVSDDRKKATLAEAAHRSFGIADQDAPLGGSGLAGLTGTADITSNSAGLIGLGLRFSTRNAFTALPIILK